MKNQEPVDVVFLWVDGNDESHRDKMSKYLPVDKSIRSKAVRTRFDQVNEIEFAVKSVIKYAAFVRNIFIVTDNQTPDFLITQEEAEKKFPQVKIIDHTVIFKDYKDFLPVFNCRPIETLIYKIPGLAEYFIYFNDDLFLTKRVNINDFFSNGNPILRGRWLQFDEDRLVKKIKKVFVKKDNKRAGHKIAQQQGAKIVGFNKYYKFEHTPHPFRKSTFVNFFKENSLVELNNVKYRFRDHTQFTPQSLINHLEIKQGTCKFEKDYKMIYFQNYKKPFLWIKYKLLYKVKRSDKLFLCMQSLDQCPKNKLDFILNWLSLKFH